MNLLVSSKLHLSQESDVVIGVNCRRKRAERASAREVELEKDIAKAAEKWNLKPLVETADK